MPVEMTIAGRKVSHRQAHAGQRSQRCLQRHCNTDRFAGCLPEGL